ncbi:MAG: flagellar basal body rod protein FlgC [Deltaproteobacteria bacterium HGW-Deltaproteobacteria-14]|jgi:flagellar basal-body rod protein FlgC|nr:MAG: flagellar basal body rod protein FlgC [Deltaproteobacteria bacterium HGW-Deltaproteobacteria-14]
MSMIKGFGILSSGMSAQRARLDLVGSNLANANTTRTQEGGPYQRRVAVFEAQGADDEPAGVSLSEVRLDQNPGPMVYDPSHPDADADGMVHMPNVNVVEEMVDMMTAARSFEANTQAFQTLRDMVAQAINIGR